MLDKTYLYKDVDESTMAVRSKTVSFIIDSHGDSIFGRLMVPAMASDTERAPVLVMLHGYPGPEQKMDKPKVLRRGGIATMDFYYPGNRGGKSY